LKGGETVKEFDLIVIGKDIYSLTVALYLSRKMRNILILEDPETLDKDYEKISVGTGNKQYQFKYQRENVASAINQPGLLHEYLLSLGIAEAIDFSEKKVDFIVDKDNNINPRINDFNQFKVYLIRNYPKEINEIQNFFHELERHYQNYKEQYLNMLNNKEYTLTSLMIEWGDYSLKGLLEKFFSNKELIQEFNYNDFTSGLDMNEISAYSFFTNYLAGLKDKFYYFYQSKKDISKLLIDKIKIINQNVFYEGRIKTIITDRQNIDYVITNTGETLKAKYYFKSGNPIDFYQKNFKVNQDDLETIKDYYPNLNTELRINTLYLALDCRVNDVDLTEVSYFFKDNNQDEVILKRLFNYSLFVKQDLRKKELLLCLDIVYSSDTVINEESIIEKLKTYFPKISKYKIESKFGKEEPYYAMLRTQKVRSNLTINEMIDVESLEHIQVYKNMFVGGYFIRPEAHFFGIISQSILFGDKIEDLLYYGKDSDTEYKYFSNDQIMMMIRHNYNYRIFPKTEVHINFIIGKSKYFIRTKEKTIVVHRGEYEGSDISIYSTNEKIADLLLKKTSFNEALESGNLKYRGDIDLVKKAANAFGLDDYQKFNRDDYIVSSYKFMGVKFLFGHILIYALLSYLSNYYQSLYIVPVALLLCLIISFVKYHYFERVNWFEIVLNFILLVYLLLSIFVDSFNKMYSDDIYLGVIIFILMLSVFINQPAVFFYHQYDMSIDYRNTKLFKIITSGLTFILGFSFLVILGGTYLTGGQYKSIFYSLLVFSIILTYYYPIIYVRANIKDK
jgi:hypothetical protein